ncbi:MAG: hypothetical protein HNEKOMLI_00317 [Sodalis sp. Psp]|nr:hypothetical protein [Sodalis sp. Psp]MCR3756812.1 hypothetical protein [Sodalis sp. Ppy]
MAWEPPCHQCTRHGKFPIRVGAVHNTDVETFLTKAEQGE